MVAPDVVKILAGHPRGHLAPLHLLPDRRPGPAGPAAAQAAAGSPGVARRVLRRALPESRMCGVAVASSMDEASGSCRASSAGRAQPARRRTAAASPPSSRSRIVRATVRTRRRPRALRRPSASAARSTSVAARSSGRVQVESPCTGQLAVAVDAPLAGPGPAHIGHPLGDLGAGCARGGVQQVGRIGPVHPHHEIEPIHEGTREAALVAGQRSRSAAATNLAARAARAGIHGRHQQEPGRVLDHALRAGHPDHALLQGLAQGIQHRRRELARARPGTAHRRWPRSPHRAGPGRCLPPTRAAIDDE